MRKPLIHILIAMPLLAVAAAVCALAYTPAPQAADIANALTAAHSAAALRYTLHIELQQPTGSVVLFDVSGEQAGEARHISGNAAGSELDMYWIEGQLYQRDFISGDWVCSAMEEDKAIELYHELSPQGLLPELAPAAFSYDGVQQLDGRKLRRVSYSAPAAGWLGGFFGEADYTLYLERRAGELRRVDISAALNEDDRYTITVQLNLDISGDAARITPPLPYIVGE
ncbi:MAG: hypothetical protein Q4B96_04120 [Bacillota bacterium]|nr:hypothetical protein [Bacillota bacterium]